MITPSISSANGVPVSTGYANEQTTATIAPAATGTSGRRESDS